MAIVNPALACTSTSGLSNTGLKCLKPANSAGDQYFTCSKWRFFYADCPKTNKLCNAGSGAWVAAITVCQQRLF